MLPLNRLIQDGLRHYHLEQGVKAAQAVQVWGRVAGPSVAAVTRADVVHDGVLIVLTRSSAWSQELSMLRDQLVAGINAELGAPALKDIRFQVKRFSSAPKAAPISKSKRILTPADREAVAALAARLEGDAATVIGGVLERQMARGDREGVCPVCHGPMDSADKICPFCA
jgi:hypothetical protein